MDRVEFPTMGFSRSWSFFDREADAVAEDERHALVLDLCARHEILRIDLVVVDDGRRVELTGRDPASVAIALAALVRAREIVGAVERLEGHGIVELAQGRRVVVAGLVDLEFRLFQRNLMLGTCSSVWVPICIDRTCELPWQVELAERNGPRLERCLREIHDALAIDVSPAPDAVDRDESVWQAGFRLVVSPRSCDAPTPSNRRPCHSILLGTCSRTRPRPTDPSAHEPCRRRARSLAPRGASRSRSRASASQRAVQARRGGLAEVLHNVAVAMHDRRAR